jgi:hypothetical protein
MCVSLVRVDSKCHNAVSGFRVLDLARACLV